MNKKALIAVFISSALLVTSCTSNLQGKFSTTPVKTTATPTATKETSSTKTKVATGTNPRNGSSSSAGSSSSTDSSESSSTTTTTNPILETITPSTNTFNTITLSTYDAADEESQWYAIGKYDYVYAEDVTICSEVILALNDGSTSYQYQSWFEDIFPEVRLQFRDSDDKFIQYIYPNSSTFSRFTVGDLGLPTSGHFYVEVRSPETVESRYKDKKLYVYLSRMCAEKDGDTYLWMDDDGNSENSYFSVTSTAVPGILGGWTKIQD